MNNKRTVQPNELFASVINQKGIRCRIPRIVILFIHWYAHLVNHLTTSMKIVFQNKYSTLLKIENLHAKTLEESVPPSQTSALGLQMKIVGPVALFKLKILTLEENSTCSPCKI
ncbi:uncharacterized protein LOC121588476 [Anopheles merus]|uniref:uncharacterized protein LOC121588476 n=1 Tax=Anopheles merus TaxID=30066 RepID=UPI001BE3D468|nr:uncharacterized protein LOC121588476 [Anopheles merus]